MKNKLNKTKDLIIAILVIILFFFMYMSYSNAKSKVATLDLVETLNDEIVHWKDKDSLNYAKIRVIETDHAKDFLKIKSSDSTITALQESVEEFKKYIKNGGSVTNITNVTEVHNHAETIVSYDKDSLPVYSSTFNYDNWIAGTVKASSDTTELKLKYRSSYTVVIGEDKVNLFNRHRYAVIKDNNPYASKPYVRSYQTSLTRVKRFGIGPYVGVGVGVGVGASLKPQINIGVGLSFNLIRF